MEPENKSYRRNGEHTFVGWSAQNEIYRLSDACTFSIHAFHRFLFHLSDATLGVIVSCKICSILLGMQLVARIRPQHTRHHVQQITSLPSINKVCNPSCTPHYGSQKRTISHFARKWEVWLNILGCQPEWRNRWTLCIEFKELVYCLIPQKQSSFWKRSAFNRELFH